MEMMNKHKDFCIFILTHGRANNVITFKTLQKSGCTYPIYFVIDNEDKQAKRYYRNFGRENVIMFDKQKYFESVDTFENFNTRSVILYARNACFDIARDLGYDYFLELDDDYCGFSYRINNKLKFPTKFLPIKNINTIIDSFLDYFKITPFKSIAMSQGGDWFGGKDSFGNPPKRKAMNTFFCKTDTPINFIGAINEDVNTYTRRQSSGSTFLTIPHIQVNQIQTQQNTGGMVDTYNQSGTYTKSFYTVMCHPSGTTINTMGVKHRRLHHCIDWNATAPKIINEKYKKSCK